MILDDRGLSGSPGVPRQRGAPDAHLVPTRIVTMSTPNPRTRSDLVAELQLPPGQAERLLETFRRSDVWLRIGLAFLAACIMWAATLAWAPRFSYRSGFTPPRDIVARTRFNVVDKEETERRRIEARGQTLAVYSNDKQPLVELRQALKDAVFQLTRSESYEKVDRQRQRAWADFLRATRIRIAEADEAFCIGSGAVADSYLRTDKILAVAQQTGSQAIHPGYGFLSENADFAEQCAAHKIRFIGPTAEQIRIFGLKHTARELATKTRVPLLPGTGLLGSLDEALHTAGHIGYPVMLKSTAGGGGIGMR